LTKLWNTSLAKANQYFGVEEEPPSNQELSLAMAKQKRLVEQGVEPNTGPNASRRNQEHGAHWNIMGIRPKFSFYKTPRSPRTNLLLSNDLPRENITAPIGNLEKCTPAVAVQEESQPWSLLP